MKSILVSGRFGSGKTAVCVGLALKFQEAGLKVGYFKPIGALASPEHREDDDVRLMTHVLKQESAMKSVLFYTGPQYLTRYERTEDNLARIVDAYRQIAADYDVVIVEGTHFPHVMASIDLDASSIAVAIGASTLVVNHPDNDFSLDRAILFSQYMSYRGAKVLGTMFNNVPRALLDKVKGIYKPLLESKGFPVYGVIPKRLEIAAPTVREYYEVLGGELLTAPDKLDLLVEELLVGAMTLESAMQYLRRAPNKAIVTGGDRSDLLLAALETSTSVLILTGGLYPDVKVLSRASEKQVPVILVHYDTYTTIERLHEVSRKIKPEDAHGIQLAKENIEKYCAWRDILRALE